MRVVYNMVVLGCLFTGTLLVFDLVMLLVYTRFYL